MKKYLIILLIISLSILSVGCSNSSVEVLELSAESNQIIASEETKITATAKDADGNTVFISPEWTIVEGSGTLDSKKGSTVTFYAEDYDTGEVTIRALYENVQDEIIIEVEPLVKGDLDNLFPAPNSLYDDLIEKTDSILIEVGEPVNYFNLSVPGYWIHDYKDQKISDNFPLKYVNYGDLVTPNPYCPFDWQEEHSPGFSYEMDVHTFPDEIIVSRDDPVFDVGIIPMDQIPRISHKKYYVLIEQDVVTPKDSIDRGQEMTWGTKETKTIEFAKATTKEVTASASWGWGSASASLSETVTEKTSNSVSIKKEETITRNVQYKNSHEKDAKVGIYQRVDVYYLSDSEGIPLDKSEHFQRWNINEINLAQEIHYKRNDRVIKDWPEDEL